MAHTTGTQTTLLLFGPLALSIDPSVLNNVRDMIVQHQDNAWLLELIRTLPQHCDAALSQLPSLHQPTGRLACRQLADLAKVFTSTAPLASSIPFPLPNALLIPLAVIAQLVQYLDFERQAAVRRPGPAKKETLGFCTGLLAAFAVTGAHHIDRLPRFGAAAVRLGMLAGLVVDGDDAAAGTGRSRSLSAAWTTNQRRDEMLSIVNDFDEAYISVYYDENRVTITTCADSICDLTHRLQDAGLSVSEIRLYGRFHSAGKDGSRSALVKQLIDFCNSPAGAAFRLPEPPSSVDCVSIPTRANDSRGSILEQGALHIHALRSILLEPARWFDAFSAATRQREGMGQQIQIVDFGHERSVPPSLVPNLAANIAIASPTGSPTGRTKAADRRSADTDRTWLTTDIAVVGMSCKLPGADSLEAFWDLLVAGRSQHREIGPSSSDSRFNFDDTLFRSAQDVNMKRKWFANLVDGHDQFDHRFFKKSARESASMDPQQRHLLQVAYQAVEQTGYFNNRASSHMTEGTDSHIGCFIGLCLADYDNNIASHPANAFTATGNLQGFIAGKVSHFFGWTAPSLTINTACSSSLVAVHQACQSILSGECEAALAGGTHIMTSATWFQNLAAGSFLSPTGQCKPFDAKADGYCRGEGVGAVFLKKMSRAIKDGDSILGVIAATAVQQNQNCTPIFVPNLPSLDSLFTKVMAKARVKPSQISVVEAHGTGTAVGDPAEYNSIRKAIGGANRRQGKQQLMVSSVKGLVGHTECASGIISLIKVLLMMNKGTLPPQASFDCVNPALESSPADQMFIPTQPAPWTADGGFRAALINNYGASGSNASAVILQAPSLTSEAAAVKLPPAAKHPFWLAGFDDKSLHRCVKAFRRYLARSDRASMSLASLSFNLARQSNRTLDSGLILTARSVEELDQDLAAFEKHADANVSKAPKAASKGPPTVILCFGGQLSSHIGLDPQVYSGIALMREHLGRVDAIVQSLGRQSIFPGIFERILSPSIDTVQLQTMLFATQYACAQCWIDSGVQPAALVGHSFGELTALCISGILSLEDTVKLIVRRATLVQDNWGHDRGAMMAVEADLHDVQQLLVDANKRHSDKPATIACYNGPRSFTLAGPAAAIDATAAQLSRGDSKYRVTKAKRLNVTNAFHSTLVEPLRGALEQSAKGLNFRKPLIPIELATEKSTSADGLTGQFVADHLRNPVYFHHALERLVRRFAGPCSQSSPCIFLEAGTNSTITTMAARALANANTTSSFSFHGVNMANCDDGWNKLTDTTTSLWKASLRVQHWAHHGSQLRYQTDMKPLLLPPYQFDPESRHWMDLKLSPKPLQEEKSGGTHDNRSSSNSTGGKQPEDLLTFFGFQDGDTQRQARFRVNTFLDKYQQLLLGHNTLETAPILSATLQISLVIDGISATNNFEYKTAKRQPQIQDVEYQSPVCFNSARTTWIEVTKVNCAPACTQWRFEVFSTSADADTSQPRMLHTRGKVSFSDPVDPSLKRQLIRYERLFGHDRAVNLLQGKDDKVDEILGSRSIYRIFSEIVDYGDSFRGLQKMVSRGNETAGHVVRLNNDPDLWFDPHLADTFCQLGGLWINCTTERGKSNVYLANGIDQWIRAHPATAEKKRPKAFDAFAVHHRASDQLSLTDVFVYDAANGSLVEVILGIAYVKVPRSSMEKLLIRLTEPSWIKDGKTLSSAAAMSTDISRKPPVVPASGRVAPLDTPNTAGDGQLFPAALKQQRDRSRVAAETELSKPEEQGSELQDLIVRVKAVIAELSGLEMAEINDDSELADLGIDSLAGMEMVHEIESTMKVKLPEAEILAVTDLPGLLKCVAGAMGVTATARASSIATAHSRSQAQPPVPLELRPTDESLHEDSEIDTPSIISSSTSNASAEAAAESALIYTNLSTPFPEALSDIDKDEGELRLSFATVMEAFNETKRQTDSRIVDMGQTRYSVEVLPLQNMLAVLLTLEVLEALGAGIRDARPGERLSRISHSKGHERLVTYLYEMLQTETQIVKLDGHGAEVITRTAVPVPAKSSKVLYQELLTSHPDQACAIKLTHYAGENLARVLTGETDGVKVIFGSDEGRKLVSHWYAEWPLNRVLIAQMEDFFTRLVAKVQARYGADGHEVSKSKPLRIMEMGAGTGGTTKRIVPLLARLGVPVEYTFTDLAPSFVAAARKTWGKQYPWMKFRVHDIEKAPTAELEGTQHFVIASNAIHATKSLCASTRNVRKALRPDGFLIMMEMTRTPFWVDIIFGLFEGWWLFEDGRHHALTHELRWETDLQAVGYGHVDWTGGERPESDIQKVILAAANPTRGCKRLPPEANLCHRLSSDASTTDCEAREQVVASYVLELTKGFNERMCRVAAVGLTHSSPRSAPDAKCVLITGATGGLGAHLVAEAALRPDVTTVICLNRVNKKQDAHERQLQALRKKGVQLPPDAMTKIEVFETDLAHPTRLGLSDEDYQSLVGRVTQIIHNAWLMHSKWPVKRFEPQLRIMAHMLNLAGDIAASRPQDSLVTFEFVSSIATVGYQPLWTGKEVVSEERVSIESVLPTGYGEAKYICERMLDATLHRYPERFRPTVVRLGQIAGSAINGHWNPMEHVSFMLKSSQTLGALPDLPGTMGWTAADDIARALVEISMQSEEVSLHPIYHIENPVRQPWSESIKTLADAMGIPRDATGIIPFREWVQRVRDWPKRKDNGPEGANPAYLLVDFLDNHFIRMSCGGLLMGTARAREHSPTLAKVGPVSDSLIRCFIQGWKDMGFLS